MDRKFVIALAFLFVFMASCSPQEHVKPRDLMGMWIPQEVNGQNIPTNQITVQQFLPLQRMVYSHPIVLPDGGNEWVEETKYRFNVLFDKNLVNFWSTEPLDWDKQFVFRTQELTDDLWTGHYEGLSATADNIPIVFRRMAFNSYPVQILGVWEKTLQEGVPGLPCRWEYFADGTFVYYTFDETAEDWVPKMDNDGAYFLYGNLLATNFTNSDVEDHPHGVRMYECWNVEYITSQDGQTTMRWTGADAGAQPRAINMKKIE